MSHCHDQRIVLGSGMGFAVTNAHGDVQHFGYWLNNYPDSTTYICRKDSGFRLNSWTFPQGVTVTVNYPATTSVNAHTYGTSPNDGVAYPNSTQILSVSNTVGRTLTVTHTTSTITQVTDGNGRTLLAPTTSAGTTDPAGNLTTFAYLAAQTTSPLQRPVPYQQLAQVFTPDNPTHANVEYDYDALGQVATIEDAEAIQNHDRGPYTFRIADGAVGERDDPMGGAYRVVYDTYRHPSLYIDELGLVTTALIDSRDRPVSYIYPEGDCEGFAYDDHNNTTAYTRVDKTGACNVNQAGNHRIQTRATYDQTWNKPLSITTPNSNVTHFTYYASGNGTSLIATATRPADGDGNVGVYNFSYDAKGRITSASIPFVGTSSGTTQSIVTTNTYDPTTESSCLTSTLDAGTSPHVAAVTTLAYDSTGNVTSTTDPRGNVTISSYDANRRKTEDDHHAGNASAALNQVSKTTYDSLGRDTVQDDVAKCFDNATTSVSIKARPWSPGWRRRRRPTHRCRRSRP